jgi:hypothetical protein
MRGLYIKAEISYNSNIYDRKFGMYWKQRVKVPRMNNAAAPVKRYRNLFFPFLGFLISSVILFAGSDRGGGGGG